MSKRISKTGRAYFVEPAMVVEDLESLLQNDGDAVTILRYTPNPNALYGGDCRANVEVLRNGNGTNPIISCGVTWQEAVHNAVASDLLIDVDGGAAKRCTK